MKLGVTLDILNQKDTPAFYADTLANRPAAGFTGRVFISTDTLDLYRDTGTTWVLLSPSSTGTITGSGAAGQVTYFSAASSITGSNDLFFDSVNGHLGIGTITPSTALTIFHDQNQIIQINQTTATNDTKIAFQNSGTPLWRIGNSYNAGANDYAIYDVVGAIQPLTIKKTSGQVLIGGGSGGSGKLVVESGLSDNGIQIVSAVAPSLRIDNANTGPTKRIGLGISTAVNNFIQGAVDKDMCIFNGSTTASPILFGVYDAGLTNTQEAARVSAARNFLIGTTTDAGQKLQVNGNSLLNGSLQANTGLFNTSTRYGSEIVGIQITDSNPIATVKAALRLSNNGSGYIPKIILTDNNIIDSYITLNPGGTSSTNYLGLGLGVSYNVLNVFENGKIGINNTTPYTSLDVRSGVARAIGSTTTDFVVGSAGSLIWMGLAAATGTTYGRIQVTSGGDTSAQPLSINGGGGNVLIGTTTDSGQKLQVNGSLSASLINSQRGTSSTLGGGASENILVIGNLTWQLVQANGDSNTTQYATAFAYVNAVGGVTIIPLGNSGISLSSSGSNLLTITNGGTAQTISWTTIILK
jgi:hypothetical protein